MSAQRYTALQIRIICFLVFLLGERRCCGIRTGLMANNGMTSFTPTWVRIT